MRPVAHVLMRVEAEVDSVCVFVKPEVHVLMRVIVVVYETGVDTEGIAREWSSCCNAFDKCDVRLFILYVSWTEYLTCCQVE